MKRKYGLLGLLLVSGADTAARNKVRPKNVLFIAVDDMKPALGCYGDPMARTPHIDALAADGVVFRRAYCQQAVSGPTRASLLTGLRPEEVGVTELNTWMRAKNPDVVTLPQAFREAGYETRGVGKIFTARKTVWTSVRGANVRRCTSIRATRSISWRSIKRERRLGPWSSRMCRTVYIST